MIHQYNGGYEIPDSPVYLFPENVSNFPEYPHSNGADPRILGRIVNNNHQPPHHHKLWLKIPRVLPNQKERFEKEDIFKRNSGKSEVNDLLGVSKY